MKKTGLLVLLALASWVPKVSAQGVTLYVNSTDPTCQGQSPCFAAIQAAVDAVQSADTIRIQAGTYVEQVQISNKNDFAGATGADRIIVEADPAAASGSVILDGAKNVCSQGHAIRFKQSKFITIRGLTITGAGGQAISLMGGINDSEAIHIEHNRIFGNGSNSCNGGITIARDNPDTLIVNNLIYANGRNGIKTIDASGGPHHIIGNTIRSNGWNGVEITRQHNVTLANNVITGNGTQSGSTGGRFGIKRENSSNPQPAGITLLNNLICGNKLGEINGPALDATDSANLTPSGTEGSGVTASAGCEIETNVYQDLEGLDALADTADDDFSLRSTSPAIDQGTDPRTLGLDPGFNPIFEADFSRDFVRPRDGDLSATAEFDMGALEFGAPVADAGEDVNALVSTEITLDGSASFDAKGGQITFGWTLVQAPVGSTAALSDSSQPQPGLTPDLPGNYVLELIVNDGTENSLPDELTLTVFAVDAPPNARAGEDQNALVGDPVFLDGSASEDPEQAPLDFSWTFNTVPTSSTLTNADIIDAQTPAPSFIPDAEGAYVSNLEVSDPLLMDNDTVRLRATQPGARPNANAGSDGLSAVGQPVVLDGSASFDSDGAPLFLSFSWVFASLPSASALTNTDIVDPATTTPSFTPDVGGSYILRLTVDDGETTDSDNVLVSVDATAPSLQFDSPINGQIVATATPTLELSFSDTESGVNTGTLSIFLGVQQLGVNCTFDTGSASCLPTAALPEGGVTLTATIEDVVGNLSPTAQVNFTVQTVVGNQPPVLDPVGNQVVALGSTLNLTLTATDPESAPLAFSASPVPLPTNSSLNAVSGVFTFTPSAAQVGIINLTFIVSDGGLTDSETVDIDVQGAAPGGVTAITGRLLDANDFDLGTETPVVGATVSFLNTGLSGVSDTQGNFTISNLPAGTQILDIDSSTADPAPGGSAYGGFREEFDLIANVTNVVDRPFFLPRIDAGSVTPVSTNTFTTVTNPTLGVSITVPPNTAKNPDGTNFTGELSISLVPRDLAPVALPDFLDPALLVTIQPVGITFATPVPITFPNTDNLTPGNQVNIWSLDPNLGVFSIVGIGVVSPDGMEINTISGGIRATDWHFQLAAQADVSDQVAGAQGGIGDSPSAAECNCTSTVQLQNGSLEVDFSLPSYRSLGVSRSLRFVYNTSWANPRPVIPFNATIQSQSAVPQAVSYKVSLAGVDQGSEVFVNTSGLNESADETIRNSISVDGTTLGTGSYPYELRLTNNFAASRVSADTGGIIQLRNESNSTIGVGWALEGVERIFTNFDNSLSVISSDGALILFTPQEVVPPFVNFLPPAGDFSTLVKNPNDTFTRTLKDGTQINFDSQGLQTSVVDRNGNTTSYSYDAIDRLISITDPANLITTFTYTGNLLSSVTDPANRTTSFTHDPQGNLTQVTFPDTTTRTFGYDDSHLMTSETDERNFTANRQYDSFGRFVSGTRKDSTPASATNIQAVGLVDPASGLGTQAFPAPVVRPAEAVNTLTDGKSNTTTFETDSFGATTRQTDALGQTTLIQRDENSNPTQITAPSGAVTVMIYDSLGNLLTSTNPVGATTTFTYNATFNQVTSITDPKNNPTTINYDANGNPVEIIDALSNKTQMIYDSRGLLTSITAAVGQPEQNTTTFTYDVNGNLLTTTDPLLNVTTLEYDVAGNVIKSTDAENRVTEFTYDSMNRLTTVLDADLNTTQYTYDNRGNLTQVTDAKNQTTTFSYDEMDRLISATNPLLLTETFTYDANGNLTSTTNRNNQTLTFDYDALNRLIQKTLPPSASQIGSQITTFQYDTVGNLAQVANPATTVVMQYDLANRLISSLSTDEETVASSVTVINQPTTIDENNGSFEGQTLQVDGTTLTVDGSHTFFNLILSNGAVLTHSSTTGTEIDQLDITVTGALQVDATSRIDVSSRGFLGGFQAANPFGGNGMTQGLQAGATDRSGASYAGEGAPNQGSPAFVYGDFRDPNDPGSGGGGIGGNGGGLARIVAGTLNLDGIIVANGGTGTICCGGGGSGGGIRIDVGTIQGAGEIQANAGNGSVNGGGGGGGRVALYYQDATSFDLTKIAAFAGFGIAAANGGAGTVYLQGPGREDGELILDNNSLIAPDESTPIVTISADPLTFTDLKILRGSKGEIEDQLSVLNDIEVSTDSRLAASDQVLASSTIRVVTRSSFDSAIDMGALTVEVTDNSTLGHLPTTGTELRKLVLTVDSLTVDATSQIDASAKGFIGGFQADNPFGGNGMTQGFQAGATDRSGASYGGEGGPNQGSPAFVYGDYRDPNDPGSGGGGIGGNGGGLVRIVAGTLNLDGIIQANGATGTVCCGGGGSGGGIRIDVGTIQGTGEILANAGNASVSGGGGGGGRVALFYQDATLFDLTKIFASAGFGLTKPSGGDLAP